MTGPFVVVPNYSYDFLRLNGTLCNIWKNNLSSTYIALYISIAIRIAPYSVLSNKYLKITLPEKTMTELMNNYYTYKH